MAKVVRITKDILPGFENNLKSNQVQKTKVNFTLC